MFFHATETQYQAANVNNTYMNI